MSVLGNVTHVGRYLNKWMSTKKKNEAAFCVQFA